VREGTFQQEDGEQGGGDGGVEVSGGSEWTRRMNEHEAAEAAEAE
jgi:hypothetical protein